MNATVKEVYNDCVEIAWEPAEGAEKYHVYWADKDISTMKYQLVGKRVQLCLKEGNACAALFKGSSCKE